MLCFTLSQVVVSTLSPPPNHYFYTLGSVHKLRKPILGFLKQTPPLPLVDICPYKIFGIRSGPVQEFHAKFLQEFSQLSLTISSRILSFFQDFFPAIVSFSKSFFQDPPGIPFRIPPGIPSVILSRTTFGIVSRILSEVPPGIHKNNKNFFRDSSKNLLRYSSRHSFGIPSGTPSGITSETTSRIASRTPSRVPPVICSGIPTGTLSKIPLRTSSGIPSGTCSGPRNTRVTKVSRQRRLLVAH